MSARWKSNVYNHYLFDEKNARLLKPIYPEAREFVEIFGKSQTLPLPGFREKNFRINSLVTEKTLRQASAITCVEGHSQSFKKKCARHGAMYAEPFWWISQIGEKLNRNKFNNARIVIGTICGKLIQMDIIRFMDPLVFLELFLSKTRILKTIYWIIFWKSKQTDKANE